MKFKVGEKVKIKKLSQDIYDQKGYDRYDGIDFIRSIFVKSPKNEWVITEKYMDDYTIENVYSGKFEELLEFEIEPFRQVSLPNYLFEL